jgi:hypothetical protein
MYTYPRRIRRRSILGHIFREKKCVLQAGKYGTYRNTDIAYKSDTKFLGIHITENLKWTTHIGILRLQLSKVCYIIKSVQGIMGLGRIRSFYHSKFESLVRYAIIFRGGR